jgi:hypothetical protein
MMRGWGPSHIFLSIGAVPNLGKWTLALRLLYAYSETR